MQLMCLRCAICVQVSTLVSPFTFAAVMFSFVLVIAAVVAEREQRLRQALRTMGMLDSAFWLSWAAWELALVGGLTATPPFPLESRREVAPQHAHTSS